MGIARGDTIDLPAPPMGEATAMANEQARSLRRRMTPQEVKLWVQLRQLRELGYHFRRQSPQQGYIVDFVCLKKKLVVEVDGGQHARHRQAIRDRERDSVLREREGSRTLRVWNNDVDRNLRGVVDSDRKSVV